MRAKPRLLSGCALVVLLMLLLVAGSSVGGWNDPYFVAGQVTLDGDEVSGATIVVENLDNGETNLVDEDGEDKDDPTTITTNSNGTYLFQLLDLDDFDDGTKIKVTATKGGETGSVTVTVDVESGAGIRDADIEFGEEDAGTTTIPALDDTTVCVLFVGIFVIVIGAILWRGRRRASGGNDNLY